MTAGMDMHRDRTEYTPVERTVEMVVAMARGELDAFSGRYVRVTSDSPASLLAAAAATALRDTVLTARARRDAHLSA